MRNDLRSRWWPIPGMVAILGALAVVAATQGWLRATPVQLPRAVQVGVRGDAGAPPTSSAVGAAKVPYAVVFPSRPVITDPPPAPTSSVNVGAARVSPAAPPSETMTVPNQPSAPWPDDGSPDAGSGTDARTTLPTASTSPTGAVTTTTQPHDE